MGLLAAETGERAKGRELVLSVRRADSMLAPLVTDMTAVSQVTAFPLLPQGLHSPSHLWQEQNLQLTGCHSDRCHCSIAYSGHFQLTAGSVFIT